MKNLIIILSACFLCCVFSCKKDKTPSITQTDFREKYTGKFNLTIIDYNDNYDPRDTIDNYYRKDTSVYHGIVTIGLDSFVMDPKATMGMLTFGDGTIRLLDLIQKLAVDTSGRLYQLLGSSDISSDNEGGFIGTDSIAFHNSYEAHRGYSHMDRTITGTRVQ